MNNLEKAYNMIKQMKNKPSFITVDKIAYNDYINKQKQNKDNKTEKEETND